MRGERLKGSKVGQEGMGRAEARAGGLEVSDGGTGGSAYVEDWGLLGGRMGGAGLWTLCVCVCVEGGLLWGSGWESPRDGAQQASRA